MALQLGALRDPSYLEAGASPEKANKAAEELAAYDAELASVRSDLRLLTWMVGGLYVLGAPALWLLLRVASKVGALG